MNVLKSIVSQSLNKKTESLFDSPFLCINFLFISNLFVKIDQLIGKPFPAVLQV